MLTSRRGVRRTGSLALALAASILGAAVSAQEDGRAKQVLVLNSTRQNEQFYVVSEREVPKLIAKGLGERVDYYTEYFDFNRFPHPDYEKVYLDFLRRKYERRHLDLLILFGDPVLDFVNSHRHIFGDTPVVFYSVDPPSRHIADSTGVINPLHFGPSIDLALALQPDLKRVYVVSGATASDRTFESRARAEFRRFDGRVEFTYLSGLVTRDLEERLRTLPPHSAVYYVVASQDGAGETFQQMAYVSRVAAAANAPTYSWADAAADSGIVGGRRRDQLAQVAAIAALAVRVLRGERADDIPVSSLNTDVDQVDWRQLRRWGLDESRLPAGARVLFREPSTWDRYKDYIVGALTLMFAQTALIVGLLIQRAKRRRAEVELRRSQSALHGSYDRIRHLNQRLLGEQEAERARIARDLHDDIGQQLAILSMELERTDGDRPRAGSATRAAQALERVDTITRSVRELSHRLHPTKLRLIGLVPALDALRRDFSRPHLSIAFSHRNVPIELDHELSLCVFRVVQEALRNAVAHSNARHVSIELVGVDPGLALTITDDGTGFDVDRVRSDGLGLVTMRERAESVGGTLDIESTPGSGTRLRFTIPLQVAPASVAAISS